MGVPWKWHRLRFAKGTNEHGWPLSSLGASRRACVADAAAQLLLERSGAGKDRCSSLAGRPFRGACGAGRAREVVLCTLGEAGRRAGAPSPLHASRRLLTGRRRCAQIVDAPLWRCYARQPRPPARYTRPQAQKPWMKPKITI